MQAETAHKKSPKAKVIKLADKISNLRALATSPAPDWSVRRKMEYITWARKVVAGLRGTNEILEKQFDEAAQAAELSLVPALLTFHDGPFWAEHNIQPNRYVRAIAWACQAVRGIFTTLVPSILPSTIERT